jgi:putative aldouronate transport system substrate-binding protein
MNIMKTKVLVLALVLIIGLLPGCKKNGVTEVLNNENENKTTNSQFTEKEPLTFKFWTPFSPSIIKGLDENQVYQELEKRTGIHMEFIHPVEGQENEEFNLMLASNQLPDIIQGELSYPGGPDKAIEDGIYLRLNELIDKYAPDYKKVREYNKEIARETSTDSGNIYGFACIQLDKEKAWAGPIIRADWLKELGLTLPTSMDDWYTVLKAFKEKKMVEAPLLFSTGWILGETSAFIGAYGITNSLYNEKGTVKYGPLEPGYKEFLITMNKWYKEGLIDKDFATRDYKSNNDMFTTEKAGAIVEVYGQLEPFISASKKNNPEFELAATPMPTRNKSDELHFRQTNFHEKRRWGIVTTACEYPEEAVKWLNYGYTEEGFLLYNYGVEGIAWNWAQGDIPETDKGFYPETLLNRNLYPKFTELMTNNPEDINFWELVPKYKVHLSSYLRNPMANVIGQEATEAMDTWNKAGNDYVMPHVTMTDEENREFSYIMEPINAFYEEMQFKFIMGIEPITKFEGFVAQIKKMRIDEAVNIKQAALDRYNKR